MPTIFLGEGREGKSCHVTRNFCGLVIFCVLLELIFAITADREPTFPFVNCTWKLNKR